MDAVLVAALDGERPGRTLVPKMGPGLQHAADDTPAQSGTLLSLRPKSTHVRRSRCACGKPGGNLPVVALAMSRFFCPWSHTPRDHDEWQAESKSRQFDAS